MIQTTLFDRPSPLPPATVAAALTSRADAIAWAREITSDPTSIFLDTETTGLNSTSEICDIAVVGRDGRVLLDTLVKPARSIPAEAARIHGISDEMVRLALSWDQVYDQLSLVLCQSYRIVVYNASYDYGIVRHCCQQEGIPHPIDRWECAMKAYAAFVGARSTHPRRPGLRWWKLSEAAEQLGVGAGTHRALADAEACRQVVLAMAGAA